MDGSGVVDDTDLDLLYEAYGSRRGYANWDSRCDLDCNGKVDWVDLGILGLYYGNEYPDP